MASAETSLLARAVALLDANTETRYRDNRFWWYAVPSKSCYPFQWSGWDSCFHAIVYAHDDSDRAMQELRSAFLWQRDDGFMPHVVFWAQEKVSRFNWHHLESAGRLDYFLPGRRPLTSAQIQPPLYAQAVEEILTHGGDPAFLEEMLGPLERLYRYLIRERDHDQDGLISIIAQSESGLDYSPAYDQLLGVNLRNRLSLGVRPRLVQLANKARRYQPDRILARGSRHAEDVLVNAVLADGLYSLARLAKQGARPELAAWASAQADRTTQALVERAWDTNRGLFFHLQGCGERPLDQVKTVASLIPLLVETLPEEQSERLVEHLTDPREFWSRYPVPSVALDEPCYLPDSHLRGVRYIWRGPRSMSTDWLLIRGLRRHNQHAVADELAGRCRECAAEHGFNEFHDAETGLPVGAPEFGWATLAAIV